MVTLAKSFEQLPENVRAGQAATEIHAQELAETIAFRIRDGSALEKAVIGKLESQREFARQYQALFPHGRNDDARDASTGVFGDKEHPAASSKDWCLGFGFTLRTVQRWCEYLVPDEQYAERKKAVIRKCWELAELWQAANYSSESNEWFTPSQYLEAARQVLTNIDLDPASNASANEMVGAGKIFTKEDDGLRQKWFGRVFLNPPYGKTSDGKESLAGAFCLKAIGEYNLGNIESCIILVNSLHSQLWQAPLYEHCICFVDHRIKFISGEGDQNKNPTMQNLFVYLGKERKKFAKVFSSFGYVMQKVQAS